MYGLAWDDEPDEYMTPLKMALKAIDQSVRLEVFDEEDDFVSAFVKHNPAFVISDLADYDEDGKLTMERGVRIAKTCATETPVYVVTNEFEVLTPASLGLPAQVQIRSKAVPPAWMAKEILDDLRKRGIFLSTSRVFVINGHDREHDGLTDQVHAFLKDQGIIVECVRNNLNEEILGGLVERMTGCVVIAICTPDDPICDPESLDVISYQPRGNVLVEMGLAMGLSQGPKRLLILQKWGDEMEEHAKLPSDFGGTIPLRLKGEFDDEFASILRGRLKDLGVAVRGS